MFETFYGFARTPFSREIPTQELYSSMMLEEMLSRLEYAAQRQLFAVITGDCGTGKTTTVRRFKDGLDPARFTVLYLADSNLTPRHFYKGLLEQLGCESKGGCGRFLGLLKRPNPSSAYILRDSLPPEIF